METTSILIGIICLALIIAPIFLLNLSRKRKGQKILSKIQSQANKNNGKITEYEYWNNYAIGIDSNARRVYYFSTLDKNKEFQEVDLLQVQACKISNIRNTETDNESLVLEFSFLNKSTNSKIEFYNSEHDGLTMHNEFQIAEKWLKTIEKCKETIKKK